MTDPKLGVAIKQLWVEIEKKSAHIADLELELADANDELDGMYAQLDELRYQQEKENNDDCA
ncbi:MAG: hypothetical protein ACOX2R_00310 [Anaerolineae bacterium]|jgi:hypothetical protein